MNNGNVSARWVRGALIAALVLTVCCGSLLIGNRVLKNHNLLLAKQGNDFTHTHKSIVGSTISTLRGHTISGQGVTLDLSHRKTGTLLLVLSPVCPYCKINFHNWRKILPWVRPDQVVWVDLTGRADGNYLASVGIPANGNVVLLNSDETVSDDLTATPTTVFMDPHGVIRWAWSGVMKDEQVNQLRSVLISPSTSVRE